MRTITDAMAEFTVEPVVDLIIGYLEDQFNTRKRILHSPGNALPNKWEIKRELSMLLSVNKDRVLVEKGLNLLIKEAVSIPGGMLMIQEFMQAGNLLFNKAENRAPYVFDTAQEMFGLSDLTIATIFEFAQSLMNVQRMDEALELFTLLSTLNTYAFEPWLLRGFCWMQKADYFEAIYSLSLASLMKFEDPWPHIYSAHCYFAVHEDKLGRDSLDLGMRYAKEEDLEKMHPMLENLKQRTRSLKGGSL